MPSESGNASWHPALMPNSAADIIEQKPTELNTSFVAEPIVDSKPDSIALPSNLVAGEDSIQNCEVQEPSEDSTAHPELSNPRDALRHH